MSLQLCTALFRHFNDLKVFGEIIVGIYFNFFNFIYFAEFSYVNTLKRESLTFVQLRQIFDNVHILNIEMYCLCLVADLCRTFSLTIE